MINLLDLELFELEELVLNLGEPKYRAKQIFQRLSKGIASIEEINNIPVSLKQKVSEIAEVQLPTVRRCQVSKDGTRKYLLEMSDGKQIESVFMKYKFGNSICVSSQAGCRMGCKFCASGLLGLDRNLSAGEILGEIIAVEMDAGEKVSHVVVMGTGEPFDNYENLSKFIRIANSKDSLGLGMRNITVSTCGIVPMIDKFGDDFPQVNLAISLHRTNDSGRSELMPINRKYGLEELISACRRYTEKTSRRITFEYTLIKGENDDAEAVRELAGLLKGMLCHVNLIPLNVVKETGFETIGRSEAQKFCDSLEKKGIPATVRRELGDDIDAACGQLRLSKNQ